MIKNILKVPMHVGIFLYICIMNRIKTEYYIAENSLNDFNGIIFEDIDYNFLGDFDAYDLTIGSYYTTDDFNNFDYCYSDLIDEKISHVHVTPI